MGQRLAHIKVTTDAREAFVDVTREVGAAVRAAGVAEGIATVWSPHTTAAVTVNEHADPDVACDVLEALRRLVPRDGGWRHVEGNADAHAKAVIVGPSVSIPVVDGELALGTWQGVFFCEFDGPRSRHLIVTVTST